MSYQSRQGGHCYQATKPISEHGQGAGPGEFTSLSWGYVTTFLLHNLSHHNADEV